MCVFLSILEASQVANLVSFKMSLKENNTKAQNAQEIRQKNTQVLIRDDSFIVNVPVFFVFPVLIKFKTLKDISKHFLTILHIITLQRKYLKTETFFCENIIQCKM